MSSQEKREERAPVLGHQLFQLDKTNTVPSPNLQSQKIFFSFFFFGGGESSAP